jgi:hypothetical protein
MNVMRIYLICDKCTRVIVTEHCRTDGTVANRCEQQLILPSKISYQAAQIKVSVSEQVCYAFGLFDGC